MKVEWKNLGHSVFVFGDWTAIAVEGKFLHLYRYRSELHNDFIGRYFSWKFIDNFILRIMSKEGKPK